MVFAGAGLGGKHSEELEEAGMCRGDRGSAQRRALWGQSVPNPCPGEELGDTGDRDGPMGWTKPRVVLDRWGQVGTGEDRAAEL